MRYRRFESPLFPAFGRLTQAREPTDLGSCDISGEAKAKDKAQHEMSGTIFKALRDLFAVAMKQRRAAMGCCEHDLESK